jgi:hypothetical protein
MAPELGPFIPARHAVVGQRHLARHRHVTPADQPRSREGVVRGVRKRRSSYSPSLQNNVWLQAGCG